MTDNGRRKRHRPRAQPRHSSLRPVLDEAAELIRAGKATEALALLEPLLEQYPDDGELQRQLGDARASAGNSLGAAGSYERALELGQDLDLLYPLGNAYIAAGLRVHAMRAFRRLLRERARHAQAAEVRRTLENLTTEIRTTANRLSVSPAIMEEGAHHFERGWRSYHAQDLKSAVQAQRRAVARLPAWLPPRNALSMALFYAGQPQEAIATAREVLELQADNAPALSHLVRFLAWTGRMDEAVEYRTRLQEASLIDGMDYVKVAEAHASLADDAAVYTLLTSPAASQALDRYGPGLSAAPRGWFLLGVAAANTGRPDKARRGWRRALAEGYAANRLPRYLKALEAGRPGPGWASRFPYFTARDMVPTMILVELSWLAAQEDMTEPASFRHQVESFLDRYPQLVRVGEKLLVEEGMPEVGVGLLATLATPEAHAILQRFAFGQEGPDDARLEAVARLADVGLVDTEAPVRVWYRGQWRELRMRRSS